MNYIITSTKCPAFSLLSFGKFRLFAERREKTRCKEQRVFSGLERREVEKRSFSEERRLTASAALLDSQFTGRLWPKYKRKEKDLCTNSERFLNGLILLTLERIVWYPMTKHRRLCAMNDYEIALTLEAETVAHRRYLHENAEVGLDMPKAVQYVMDELEKAGLQPETCGHGVTAQLGQGGKTLLLRADMDALPMPESSGEAFACPTGTEAHACGHDFHAAMLLTAAKILKQQEASLQGTVRFMFQPAEETFEGSRDMIANGILEGVDGALAFHVSPGKMPVGLVMYNSTGTMMFSVDGFRITIHGKGGHGAYPHTSIDPINIGVHLHLALQELIAREADPTHACVLTVGQFSAGSAPNIIPDEALLQGTLRTNNRDSRDKLVRRIEEVAQAVAKVYGGSAELQWISQVPPLICSSALTESVVRYLKELPIPGLSFYPGASASASEDFAVIAEAVPSAFLYLSAGFQDERGAYPAHNPKVRFNEAVCPIGVASLVHCAKRWLEDNA